MFNKPSNYGIRLTLPWIFNNVCDGRYPLADYDVYHEKITKYDDNFSLIYDAPYPTKNTFRTFR